MSNYITRGELQVLLGDDLGRSVWALADRKLKTTYNKKVISKSKTGTYSQWVRAYKIYNLVKLINSKIIHTNSGIEGIWQKHKSYIIDKLKEFRDDRT